MPSRTPVPVLSNSLRFRARPFLFFRSALFPRGIHLSWPVGVLRDRQAGSLTSLKLRSWHRGHFGGEASVLGTTHGAWEPPRGVSEIPGLGLNVNPAGSTVQVQHRRRNHRRSFPRGIVALLGTRGSPRRSERCCIHSHCPASASASPFKFLLPSVPSCCSHMPPSLVVTWPSGVLLLPAVASYVLPVQSFSSLCSLVHARTLAFLLKSIPSRPAFQQDLHIVFLHERDFLIV